MAPGADILAKTIAAQLKSGVLVCCCAECPIWPFSHLGMLMVHCITKPLHDLEGKRAIDSLALGNETSVDKSIMIKKDDKHHFLD